MNNYHFSEETRNTLSVTIISYQFLKNTFFLKNQLFLCKYFFVDACYKTLIP